MAERQRLNGSSFVLNGSSSHSSSSISNSSSAGGAMIGSQLDHVSISIQTPTLEAAAANAQHQQQLEQQQQQQQQTTLKKKEEEKEAVLICGRDFSQRTPKFQFLFACTGVLGFYTLYGYVLEFIFRTEGVKTHGAFITFVQFLLYTLFAFIERTAIAGSVPTGVPWRTYSLLALLTVTTMVCSNSALGYLSYPTQVILKCCKLIPTMIGGILIQGKRYNRFDVTAMFCMIIGCIWFTLADVKVQPNFHLFGIFLMCLALCADGAIGNVQERTMKALNHSATEVILYTFLIGDVYIGMGLIVTNNMLPGLRFCNSHPVRIYSSVLVLSLCGYLGMQFVLMLVRAYGALPAVTVTTCRKVLTISLSFLLFAKPFTVQYIWAGLLVICGIYLNLYSKNKLKWDSLALEYYRKIHFKFKGKRVLSLQAFGKATTV